MDDELDTQRHFLVHVSLTRHVFDRLWGLVSQQACFERISIYLTWGPLSNIREGVWEWNAETAEDVIVKRAPFSFTKRTLE